MLAEGVHFPRAVRRQEADQLRLDADPLSQRHIGPQEPLLCGAPTPTAKTRSAPRSSTGRRTASYDRRKPLEECRVQLKDHHDGYIDQAEFDLEQAQLALNNYAKVGGAKSGRGGRAAGRDVILRPVRSPRDDELPPGRPPGQPVYRCDRPNLMRRGYPVASPLAACASAPRWPGELLRAVEPDGDRGGGGG